MGVPVQTEEVHECPGSGTVRVRRVQIIFPCAQKIAAGKKAVKKSAPPFGLGNVVLGRDAVAWLPPQGGDPYAVAGLLIRLTIDQG
jgi:hypothetical protein